MREECCVEESGGFTLVIRDTEASIYAPVEIESSSAAILCEHLRAAPSTYQVNFYLGGCVGGCCFTGQKIISAMNSCAANITCYADAPVQSMASLIALSGDKLYLLPNSFLMFHNYSTDYSGKGASILAGVYHNHKFLITQSDTICYPFLTQKELKLLKKDTDIFIHWDDKTLEDRFTRHFVGDNDDE